MNLSGNETLLHSTAKQNSWTWWKVWPFFLLISFCPLYFKLFGQEQQQMNHDAASEDVSCRKWSWEITLDRWCFWECGNQEVHILFFVDSLKTNPIFLQKYWKCSRVSWLFMTTLCRPWLTFMMWSVVVWNVAVPGLSFTGDPWAHCCNGSRECVNFYLQF